MEKRTKLQIISSSFVITAGLFVILAMGNSVTGRVIGADIQSPMKIIVALWGILVVIAGIWMIRKKDFNKSVFD